MFQRNDTGNGRAFGSAGLSSLQIITFVCLALVAAGGVFFYVSSRTPFAERPPAVGTKAPKIDLADSTGRMVSLGSYTGRPLIVYFWADWCPPCKTQLVLLEELSREVGDDALGIVAIALDDVPAGLALDKGITFPLVRINPRVREAWGDINHVPATYVIDPSGFIVSKTGQYPTKEELRRLVLEMTPAGV